MNPVGIAIAGLTIDETVQQRLKLNEEKVLEYAERMKDGDEFPPIDVYRDGTTFIVADGFHRVAAAKRARLTGIECTIHVGTLRDARLHSCSANRRHGFPASNADKRKAVFTMMADPEWAKWSDRKIAKHVGVSQPFVSKLRHEQVDNGYQQISKLRDPFAAPPTHEDDSHYRYDLPDLDGSRCWAGVGTARHDVPGIVYVVPYERDPAFYWVQLLTLDGERSSFSVATKKPVAIDYVRFQLSHFMRDAGWNTDPRLRWTERNLRVVEAHKAEQIRTGNWFSCIVDADEYPAAVEAEEDLGRVLGKVETARTMLKEATTPKEMLATIATAKEAKREAVAMTRGAEKQLALLLKGDA